MYTHLQIESIMASFGAGLVRESVYIQDFQKEFERMFDGKYQVDQLIYLHVSVML